jgi:small ligand-binding sensory domain FIST
MPFTNAISTNGSFRLAAQEVAQAVNTALGAPPDLMIVFYSPHHTEDIEELNELLRTQTNAKATLGVLGESVIAGTKELENLPGLSVWAGHWGSSAQIDLFALTVENTPDGPSLMGYPDVMFEESLNDALLLTFGDPYTFPVVELFLPQINENHPGLTVAGGMASNPTGPGAKALILDERVIEEGAVCALIRGVKFSTIVSQGCRPIGKPMIVTKGQENIIHEIGGQTPLNYLKRLLEELPEHDKDLMQRGLLIGVAITEYRDQFRRGDFLIRNLIGMDARSGALALTDLIRPGQTIQFQIRDAATAGEDLTEMMITARDNGAKPSAGLIFSCNGRGSRMFGTSDHDASTIQRTLGPIPLAGFFAAGELGPIGGKNFIHGFTASTVIFE